MIPPPSKDAEIAAWVIIVPIVIGVLVIIIIVVCLYNVSPPLTLLFCVYMTFIYCYQSGFFNLKEVDKDEIELNQDDTPDGDKPEASEL